MAQGREHLPDVSDRDTSGRAWLGQECVCGYGAFAADGLRAELMALGVDIADGPSLVGKQIQRRQVGTRLEGG